MRLTQVRVQNYRCIRDTGWFEVEQAKTILVGPNEAGKTAVLEALQRINPPAGVRAVRPSARLPTQALQCRHPIAEARSERYPRCLRLVRA